jgi:hypothetical protein
LFPFSRYGGVFSMGGDTGPRENEIAEAVEILRRAGLPVTGVVLVMGTSSFVSGLKVINDAATAMLGPCHMTELILIESDNVHTKDDWHQELREAIEADVSNRLRSIGLDASKVKLFPRGPQSRG